jgi:heptose-I-phosphate ethanolaminephosphotransferase
VKNFNQILKQLRTIYPEFFVLLSISPLLVGYVIDSGLVEIREVIINLVWIPIFTIPYLYLQKRFIFQFANFFYYTVGLIEISHWVILKGPISVTSILVISNTNIQEAVEFFDLKATYGLLILIPFTIIFVLSIRKKIIPIIHPFKSYVVFTVILLIIIFISENIVAGRLIRKGIPHFAKVTISFYDKYNLYKESSKEVRVNPIDAKLSYSGKSQTFVLILGESCNRNHMSLYGYSRNTTPKLDKRKDIIVFNNAVSPYSNTLNSVLTILSESNLENKIEITKGIDIIDVFHAAGFKTYWISNQSPIGIWDNLVTIFANKSDYKNGVEERDKR